MLGHKYIYTAHRCKLLELVDVLPVFLKHHVSMQDTKKVQKMNLQGNLLKCIILNEI